MIFNSTYLQLAGALCFIASVTTNAWAAEAGQQPDRIKQILMNTKLGEMDMDAAQSGGAGNRDVNSVQYKIGFKDGYQKAVVDLKNSLNEGTLNSAKPEKVAQSSNEDLAKKKATLAGLAEKFHELASQSDWTNAIDAASKAIELDPRDPIAYINRSWAYAEQGNFKQALADADKAVKLNPENGMAYNNRAYAYELSGALTKAKKEYKASCDLNYKPACETVAKFEKAMTGNTIAEVKELLNRSYEKFRQKDWKAVEQISTRAISLDPSNAMAYVNRSGARAELGLLSTALDDCNRAIQLNPGLGVAHNNCGYTYELMGRLKQAELEYQQACNLGVKQSCKDYHRISR